MSIPGCKFSIFSFCYVAPRHVLSKNTYDSLSFLIQVARFYLLYSEDHHNTPHSPSSCPSKTEIRSQLTHIDTVVTKKFINSCRFVFTHLTKENRNGSVCYCQCCGSKMKHECNRTRALTGLTAPVFIS